VWEHYRPQLTAGLAAILLQAGIIALLLVERRRPEASKPRHEVVRLNRVTTATVLSSSIAHELNQPLGAILCNTEAARMLLKADPPDLAQLGEIRPIAAPLPDMEGSLWLLTHPDLRKVARIRTVLDFMADALSRQRDPIEGRHRKSAAPEPNCHSLVKS
jgi:C4-dicarboxylate-specific signal transduction histidine kinase